MRRLLLLQQHSYQPQALLKRTKEFFEREELLDKYQTTARSNFVDIFKTGGPEFVLDQTESQLRMLMQSLDTFFFSSLLTRDQDPIVRLEFGENIFGEIGTLEERGSLTLGRTEGEMETRGASTFKLRIRVEACDPWSREEHTVRRDLTCLLETLVHEMAHAYYISFTCLCGLCQREMGARGHGPAWQELKQAMYMTIRRWDRDLWGFYTNDQDALDKV
ncbi:hypothetical protein INS49_002288 [Diaporthe citri]|uniref:uncharacterized protein n=1 Tax=Diaporthe citri TaxID=83186 RepID=UPI001C7ED569|nr:uncharacterized protein INS49_002288 [Diaporthe citri]KAG6368088.1 hypothetical protein INS49_002288 [Diaporthe citri]